MPIDIVQLTSLELATLLFSLEAGNDCHRKNCDCSAELIQYSHALHDSLANEYNKRGLEYTMFSK